MKTRKIVIQIAAYSLLVLLFVFSVGFASHKQSQMLCSGVVVKLDDSANTGFVNSEDVLQSIQDKFGDLTGKTVSSINKSLLEKIINTNPFIYNAEVFSTIDGKLIIEVKQRIPVLRVINYKNEVFYIDKEGVFMPQSEKVGARVPVASGYIFDSEAERKILPGEISLNDSLPSISKISQLFKIATFVANNDLWNAQAQQLYVNENGDIEFIPLVGDHTVILGDDQFLNEKFMNLFYFYKQGLNKKGWGNYSAINLKYKNQVVCIKK